jgi:hypothetical protein
MRRLENEKDFSQRRRGAGLLYLILYLLSSFDFRNNISYIKKIFRMKTLRLCAPAPLRDVFCAPCASARCLSRKKSLTVSVRLFILRLSNQLLII